ncbi:MAG TPA: glycerophosphodiester phosphodiesterase [Terriglobales bacterium]|jgi:glycerophosphoryl diester phosphodiesterase|nr:glycerophosphodiester phosphodiesterase [Terriglobales bacterium]
MRDRPLLLGHRGARAVTTIPENTLPSFQLALRHGCDGFELDVRLAKCGAVICHDAEFHGVRVSAVNDAKSVNLATLDEVLRTFSKQAFLNIEIKVPGLASEVLLAISENPPERGYAVSSFLPEVLTDLNARDESIPLGFIVDDRTHLSHWRDLAVQYVIPQHSLVTPELIREVHEASRILFTWTVNDARRMRLLADWGVDGIISDQTELLVKTLRPHGDN